jgi:hypothetical protein
MQTAVREMPQNAMGPDRTQTNRLDVGKPTRKYAAKYLWINATALATRRVLAAKRHRRGDKIIAIAGLSSARARGRSGGRPYTMTPAKLRLAQAAMAKCDTQKTSGSSRGHDDVGEYPPGHVIRSDQWHWQR